MPDLSSVSDEELRRLAGTPAAQPSPAAGMSDDELMKLAKAPPGPTWGAPQQFVNSALFGTLPNVNAGAVALTNPIARALGLTSDTMGQAYDKELTAQQDARHAYRTENPGRAIVGDILGGLYTGGAMARGGATVVGRIPGRGLENLGARTVAGGAEGAGIAGLYGFGSGEGGLDQRVENAKANIPLGAVFGALAPAATEVLRRVGNTVRNAWTGFTDPERQAGTLVARRLMRDQRTPDDIATAVEAARTAGQPEVVAADVGGTNARRLLGTASRTPGQFRDEAVEAAVRRQAGQGERLTSYTDDALGQGSTAYQTEQNLIAQRRAAADPAYTTSYRTQVPHDAFYEEMLGRQSVRDAMQRMEHVARENNQPITEFFREIPNPNARTVTRQVPTTVLGPDGAPVMRTETVVENPTLRVPTMRGWDFIRRDVQAQTDAAYARPGGSTDATSLGITRDALRGRLAADNPDYAAALAQYTDDSRAIGSIQTGRDVIRAANPDQALDELAQPMVDRALARAGASREVGSKLDRLPEGSDKTRVFQTPNMERKLDALVDDPVARQVLRDRIGRERTMVATNNEIRGGSPTSERLMDQADTGATGPVFANLLLGRPIRALASAAGNVASGVARHSLGMNEDVARGVGQYLMSNDPARIRGLNELYAALQARVNAPTLAPLFADYASQAPRQIARR